MQKNQLYHYYVEGDCEKKLIDTLKSPDMSILVAGKVSVFNPVQEIFTSMRLMQLKMGTTVILVFDTDTKSADMTSLWKLIKCSMIMHKEYSQWEQNNQV